MKYEIYEQYMYCSELTGSYSKFWWTLANHIKRAKSFFLAIKEHCGV